MKLLWKNFAVLLLICCQAASGQNTASKSDAPAPPNICVTHPAGSGVEILSDTSGVDFNSYARDWFTTTYLNWFGFIPKKAKWPRLAKGQVQIRLRILPDGIVNPRDIVVEVSSGDRALDHAAVKAIKKSKYPPLPQKFQRPYLEMRACFFYNMQSSDDSSASVGDKAPKS